MLSSDIKYYLSMEHASHGSNTKTKVVFTDGKVDYYDFKLRHQSDDYVKSNLWIFVNCYGEHLKINGSIIQDLRDATPPAGNYWRLPMEERLALRNANDNPKASPNVHVKASRQSNGSIWAFISSNPLVAGILATIIGGLILAALLKLF